MSYTPPATDMFVFGSAITNDPTKHDHVENKHYDYFMALRFHISKTDPQGPALCQKDMPNPFLRPGSRRYRNQGITDKQWKHLHLPLDPYRAFDDHTLAEVDEMLVKMEDMNGEIIQRHDSVHSISAATTPPLNLTSSNSTPVLSSLHSRIKSWKPRKSTTWPLKFTKHAPEENAKETRHAPLISMQLDDDELRRQCRVLFEGLYNPHHGLVEQRRKRLYELLGEHAELRKLTALEVDERDDEQDEDDRMDEIYDEDEEALFQARGDASNNNSSFTPTHKKVKKSWSWKKVKKIATWPPKSRRVGKDKDKKKRLEEDDEQDLANSRGRQRER
ncbi:hypothetical protein D6C86_02575 [Aureobasidium pullulans]|uniref:Uncharacterized protein n=1 Tax=Aureobasidium pullulans TaxID=5580 RepID=A0A4S9YJR1_AURPU|nr:hypothetical protein D6C94_04516 [Aureobasidium pullulans]THZ36529.1 hypothetical protein D6C87_09105 [Aureobasidium pullulans]THZ64544.1 hypothetical protein D6C86_02575 [Aureobasidium pullulans]THZ93610.1 hypothetical protein D6C88_02658 [Aureobasidium pullulans]